MKVVFLDFDGVLNSAEWHKARHEAGADMEHLYPKLVHIDDLRGLTAEYIPAILKHLEG